MTPNTIPRAYWAAIGAGTGIAPGVVLALVVEPAPVGVVLGVGFGLAYALTFRSSEGTALDHSLGAAAMAIPAWMLVEVMTLPLLRGSDPAWTAAELALLVPELAAWVVGGTLFGALVSPVTATVESHIEFPAGDAEPATETRIVVLGGGFAGLAAAQRLEALFGPDPTVELTLVSETNAILFTPMLAEVAAGSLDPNHITSPLRTSLRRTRVVRAEATDVNLEDGRVHLDGRERADRDDFQGELEVAEDGGVEAASASVEYDHLVLAVGSETNYFGMEGVREFAFDFKSLRDAMALHSHVIDCFERAVRVDDPERRRALVTFVIAGGGFAGAELAGALNDLAHELLVHYPNIPPEEVEVVLVHSGERIMPALSESLSAYAHDRMRERGIGFHLETRVEGADPDAGTVSLSGGEAIRTDTLVWTAGVRPNSLLERLDVPLAETGAVRTEATFAVPGREGVWAVGDCAAVTDPETGELHPNTAQYATRAGCRLADNVHATVRGRDPEPMTYRSRGLLAVIGHQTACAEIRGHRFSGLFAWLLWRAVYLFKLPGTERKIRVFVSWFVELFFSRDIAQTLDPEIREALRDER